MHYALNRNTYQTLQYLDIPPYLAVIRSGNDTEMNKQPRGNLHGENHCVQNSEELRSE